MHRRPQFEPLARLAAAGYGLLGSWVLREWVYPVGCGCLGPLSCVGAFDQLDAAAAAMPPVRVWVGCALWFSAWRLALSLAWARLSCRMQLRRLCRRCAFGLAVPFGFRLGAWPLVSRGRVCPAGCSCGGYAAERS